MTEIEDYKEKLLKLPKEMLVHFISTKMINYLYIKKLDPNKQIIDMKIEYNFKQQRDVMQQIDNHENYRGTDRIKWLKNHEQWQKLNHKLDKLWKELDVLNEEREK